MSRLIGLGVLLLVIGGCAQQARVGSLEHAKLQETNKAVADCYWDYSRRYPNVQMVDVMSYCRQRHGLTGLSAQTVGSPSF